MLRSLLMSGMLDCVCIVIYGGVKWCIYLLLSVILDCVCIVIYGGVKWCIDLYL